MLPPSIIESDAGRDDILHELAAEGVSNANLQATGGVEMQVPTSAVDDVRPISAKDTKMRRTIFGFIMR